MELIGIFHTIYFLLIENQEKVSDDDDGDDGGGDDKKNITHLLFILDNKSVLVYDVLFGAGTIEFARKDDRFKTMLIETATKGIEQKFGDVVHITSM